MKNFKKVLFLFLISSGVLTVLYGGVYLYAWINPRLALNNANSFYFYDIDSNLITGTDEWISYENIDKDIINATIAIEDRHFFTHIGFDYLRIGKALYTNMLAKSNNSGASTITQQYAKNLFLTFDKKWSRKLTEAWLTVRMEVHYTKEEIIEGYLNTINYGGIYGIENASKFYFNKSSSDLTLSEASMLVGIPNRPSEYSPLVNLESSKKRQKTVLNSMLRDNLITDLESKEAYNQELVFKTNEDKESLNTLAYYQDCVLNELKTITSIPTSLLTTGGLKIYTNFDPNAQKSIEDTVDNYIKGDIEVSSVIMKPSTGQVLGLTGGVDYSKSQFNRATSSTRSVGSTIKPFLYYSALENNFTSSTTFTSEKTTFVFSENQTYSPTNFGDSYPNKKISLAAAIAFSDNIYAVKTHLFLGEKSLVETMKRVGVSNLDSIPSLALGSQGISLLDMTNAYATLANEGNKIKPYFISKVEDIDGKILYEHKENHELVLNKSITYILNELLSNTTNNSFISYSYPTGYSFAHKLKRKYGIKTGTTEYDHLVFGYNKDIVVGIWSGYDDNRLITSDDTYNNKQMWADITESYMKDKPESWYEMPNNVVGVMTDVITGDVAKSGSKNSSILYYIKGTEPSANSNLDDAIPTIKID